MKTSILTALPLALTIILSACSDNSPVVGPEPMLYISPSSLTFGADGGTLSISLTSSAEWSVSSQSDWLTFSPSSGDASGKVSVTARPNTSGSARSGELIVTAGRLPAQIVPVKQNVAQQSSVEMFESTDAMASALSEHVARNEYAEALSVENDVIKMSFAGSSMRGIKKGATVLVTLDANNNLLVDGVSTGVVDTQIRNVKPTVEVAADGDLLINNRRMGCKVNDSGNALSLRCVINAAKHLYFAFSDSRVIMIGSQINGVYNPPIPTGVDTLKILFIGNSYSMDAINHLPGMLRAAGIGNVRMACAYRGSYTIPEYYANFSTEDLCTYYHCEPGSSSWESLGSMNHRLDRLLYSDTWDIVTLQEDTGNTKGYAWVWNQTVGDAVNGLCNLIQEAQPNHRPTIGYIMTQAASRYDTYMIPKYFASQTAMFETIVGHVQTLMANSCIDLVIPTGTTFQNLRTTSLNVDNRMDLTRDGDHMDFGISRYAAAATTFMTLITPATGVAIDGNSYRYSSSNTSTNYYSTPVTDKNAPIAIEAARAACNNPFAITSMSNY